MIEPTQQTLRARAQALSRADEDTAVNEDQIEVLEFELAHESYAIEFRFVREVCTLKGLTPVPGVPSFVLGIINVRGQILSVIDMKRFLELPDQGMTESSKAVVIADETMEFAILADVVRGVRAVSATDLASSLSTLSGIRQDYLRGLARDRMVVLDASKILEEKALVINDRG